MSDYFINTPTNTNPSTLTTDILRTSNALDYHQSLPLYQPTPLVHLPGLAKKYNVGNIYVKDESYRFGLNAFKGLGASYAIHKVLERQLNIDTFCTATDGNHGRAVAWAAKMANKQSVVYVPKDTTPERIKAIEQEGAEVIKSDQHYDETCDIARSTSRNNGWQLVQDAAWEGYEEIPALIMAGYLTHFKELEPTLHQLPQSKIDIVFLQAGVGSWAGSAIWYYLNRYGSHRPKLVIVEPNQAAGILASFKADQRTIPNGSYETIMAGLNCGIPSLGAWNIIKNGTDVSMKIQDEYARQAIRELYYPRGADPRIIGGESGVGGLAGFIAIMTQTGNEVQALKDHLGITPKSNILFYNTEGATDLKSFKSIVQL